MAGDVAPFHIVNGPLVVAGDSASAFPREFSALDGGMVSVGRQGFVSDLHCQIVRTGSQSGAGFIEGHTPNSGTMGLQC